MRFVKLALSLSLASGCGATLVNGGAEVEPAVPREATNLPDQPIELSIHVPFADFIEVGELRGRPGLLFFFSTWDGVSQAMLTPLSRMIDAYPECFFVGVAVQPDARTLVDAWSHALEPPFPVGWEPKDTLTTERSPVGRIEGVPTVVTVDPEGRPVEKVHGMLTATELDAMLARVAGRERPSSEE